MFKTKQTSSSTIIYSYDQLVNFVAINVHEKDEENTKAALSEAVELCKLGELGDQVFIDENAFLVIRMAKKRLWASIQLYLSLNAVQSEFVFLITKI